jgi:hypothetical protein
MLVEGGGDRLGVVIVRSLLLILLSGPFVPFIFHMRVLKCAVAGCGKGECCARSTAFLSPSQSSYRKVELSNLKEKRVSVKGILDVERPNRKRFDEVDLQSKKI